jgi:hypothetical protein
MDKEQWTTSAGIPVADNQNFFHGLAKGIVARSRKADSYDQLDRVIESN